jgi:hypothetical protein
MSEKNLQQRKLAIMQEAQTIDKKGLNKFSNYKYVRAVDVIEEIQKLLIKHGVTISISETECEREIQGKNFHTTLKCQAIFRNVDKPEDQETITYYSISADTLDKDIFKAKTNGLKYLLTETFMLVTDALIDTEEDDCNESKKDWKNNNDLHEANDLFETVNSQSNDTTRKGDILNNSNLSPDNVEKQQNPVVKPKGDFEKFKKVILEAKDDKKLAGVESKLSEKVWAEGEEAQLKELIFQKASSMFK